MHLIAKARMSIVTAMLLISTLVSPPPVSGSPDAIATAVDGAFQPLLAQYDVPGIAVAVTISGEQRFFSYGLASKETRTPINPDTLFEIGSVSKTVTATFVSYAQALGRLSLTDHPGKYMPQLLGSPIDAANLLNLGTYTSGGLPLQFPPEVTNTADMEKYFQRWTPQALPGQQRRYSNPSIGLFGHVAALAMGGDFSSLVESQVFPKVGLANSYIRVPPEQMQRYAWGYRADGTPIRVNPGVFDAEAYGVKASAADMIRFVEANIRPDLLADVAIRDAVEATHVGRFEVGEMTQGLGWEQYPYPVSLERLLAGNSPAMAMDAQPAKPVSRPLGDRPTFYNKTGSTNGFGAYAAFVPAKGIGIVMLANKNFPIPARIEAAYAVLDAMASEAR